MTKLFSNWFSRIQHTSTSIPTVQERNEVPTLPQPTISPVVSRNEVLNKLFIKFAKRAEKIDKEALVETFVDVGPLLALLSTIDNQILYGRRGTGKTHALVYLAETVKNKGDIPVYVDLRSIGSTGGIYSDQNIPFHERATDF